MWRKQVAALVAALVIGVAMAGSARASEILNLYIIDCDESPVAFGTDVQVELFDDQGGYVETQSKTVGFISTPPNVTFTFGTIGNGYTVNVTIDAPTGVAEVHYLTYQDDLCCEEWSTGRNGSTPFCNCDICDSVSQGLVTLVYGGGIYYESP